MQYRDIEIKIVRMAAPGGWKWTVAIDGKERNGSAADRETAIHVAKRYIDGRLGRRKPIASASGADPGGSDDACCSNDGYFVSTDARRSRRRSFRPDRGDTCTRDRASQPKVVPTTQKAR